MLPIVPEGPPQEHIEHHRIDHNLTQYSEYHSVCPFFLPDLLPMHFLHIEGEVTVAHLERQQHEGYGEVPQFHQWGGCQVQE